MNRCTVIDLLEDKYGLNKDELSKRELAIIGLCTNELADDEEQELNLHLVSLSFKAGDKILVCGQLITEVIKVDGEKIYFLDEQKVECWDTVEVINPYSS